MVRPGARIRVVSTRGYPERLLPRLAAGATLLAAGWLAISPWALGYPFTEDGVDATWRAIMLGVAVGLVSALRLRGPDRAWRSCLTSGLLGAALLLAPVLFGYGADGPLASVWWNETITGAAVLVFSVLGIAGLNRERDDVSRPS